MKAAGIALFLFCFAATAFINVRLEKHRLPDKPIWGRWTFDSVDEVGRRWLRWMLFLTFLGFVDVIVLIVTQ